MHLYILNEDHTFRLANDIMEWGEFMEKGQEDPLHRHVARSYFYVDGVDYCNLSTVFLGIDNGLGERSPMLFESLIFGGEDLDDSMLRYSTWDQARSGHEEFTYRIVNRINRRFKIASNYTRQQGKRTDFFFVREIEGHIKFTKDDLRLIRES